MKIIGKFVLRIIFFLSVISSLIYFHFETLYGFFLTNQTLNTLILSVILIGIIFILRQIFLIESEVKWLNNLLKTQKGLKITLFFFTLYGEACKAYSINALNIPFLGQNPLNSYQCD